MELIKNKLQIIVILVFLGFVGWWISIQSSLSHPGLSLKWFDSVSYGTVALIGAVVGLAASKKWGGYKSVLGKSLLLFSLGLFAQYAGQVISAYYIYISKVGLPYPSWGDAGFFGSTVLYIIAGIYLAKSVGVRFSLKTNKYKIIAFIIPAILLVASYWVFLHNHQFYWRHHPLTAFLDAGYPIGDALYISMGIIAYLLSRKMLGGIMRAGILILIVALVAQYVADWTFLFQNSRGTYLSGNYDDLFYLIAYFVISTAMVQFLRTFKNLKARNIENHTAKAEG